MERDFLTDEQVDIEIERLNGSEAVRLARLERSVKLRRRKYLYDLRWLEKRGKQLKQEGITDEKLREMYADIEKQDEE